MTAFIGTAGWSLRREQKALFGDGGSHLARYATRLNAVEINSSFYRPHRRATYARWANSVPETFRFAVKLPRVITHTARLQDVTPLAAFHDQVSGLGVRLGPILVQLPPSLAFDAETGIAFFTILRQYFPGGIVCEPRHASWFGAAAEALLKDFHVARVAADPARAPNAGVPGGWTGMRYFRWHGAPVIYRSAYAADALTRLAANLRPGDWCIFDNTSDGAATTNALAMARLKIGTAVT